ncbi:MAG: 4Fe-4S binding protein [Oryzomonas sp.]|nr:4Fe-4S binding protein [Oryzomonas sp.]
MESILLCTACGACMERCPYELPVTEILKSNYALYEWHLKEAQAG